MDTFSVIRKLKIKIRNSVTYQKYQQALELIELCASIMYEVNQEYDDSFLENQLEIIGENIGNIKFKHCNGESVIFYDGFGLDNRGLCRIYVKALCKNRNLVYVVNSSYESRIPKTLKLIKEMGGRIIFLNGKSKFNRLLELDSIISDICPSHFFYYSRPDDSYAVSLMYKYKGYMQRFIINLTDHAFGLGARAFDKYIEFRNYGASITYEYRGVEKDKIVLLPFYPISNPNEDFKGYPFNVKNDQKIIFSGGALYKTYDSENSYYKLVDAILQSNKKIVFWYAGSGNHDQMDLLCEKYPDRVFFTKEREDLCGVLKNCFIYLSTYPLAGGLMFQYAALSGKIPITLINQKMEAVSGGFLINQLDLGIEFSDIDSVVSEIDKLYNNSDYLREKEELVSQSLISSVQFEKEVLHLISSGKTSFEIEYKHIDSSNIRQWYMDNFKNERLEELILFSKSKTAYCMFTKHVIKAGIKKVLKRQ